MDDPRTDRDATEADLLSPTPTPLARRLAHAAEVIRTEAAAIAGLEDRLGAAFGHAVDRVLACTGTVVVTGMGKAGLVGAKISATLASTGTPSISLHPGEALHGDLGRVRSVDLLIALSNSGETAEIKALLPATKRIGAPIVAITESAESTLGRHADVVLELGPVGEACPLGLAPTASTSAMLALGDALAMVVSKERGFSREDYARYHPAGSLGRKLMRVREVMRMDGELPLVPAGSKLSHVLHVISRTPGRPGAALIVDPAGRLVGVFTDGDLRRWLSESPGDPSAANIDDHMGTNPKWIGPDRLVDEAMAILKEHRIDQLAVLDDERRPMGLLDVQDVLDLRT
ncbi:Arabinose 5-phosphate isomerase KdsD [Planctomycetes bacterium Pla163]|uniref:Arabinose 5-phosphate isomerase KdsD n=1 Tax=Rohdeia mirabilis TaxID=2528008 RepID=A0A518CUM3_9BACT|nr:Arabinose 5-phosphate isomerase KdsD [Planctomycetes bacterium Pla163]